MSEILLENIPEEYNLMMKQVNNVKHKVINKILSYNQFSFFRYKSITNEIDKSKYCHEFQHFLFKYLIQFKLISYQYSSIYKYFDCFKYLRVISESSTQLNSKEKDSNQHIDVIFCCEKHCLIITEVYISIINDVIQKLKEKDVIFIDVNQNWNSTNEIFNFYNYHRELIIKNKFIGYILNPTFGYLIKRYFYPTEYFKDPSFFNIGQIQKLNEQKSFQNLNNALFNDDLINKHEFKKTIKEIKSDKSHIIKSIFNENDFIVLKDIYSTDVSTYKLVIHIESLYIYTMKKIDPKYEENFDREISFCNEYEHRCFVPFYGFLTNKNKILGFIYEYMVNDSLQNFIECTSNNKIISSNIFLINTINRLIQGINYLHSNNLIHRDLKSSNILIDHDYQVFINDYETIRNINSQDNLSTKTLTCNIGNLYYVSPEQNNSDKYSFPTDIFSFGKIITFLLDKQKKKNKELKNIKELYEKCTNKEADERLNCKEIIELIKKEINTFHYYVQYLMNDEINQKEMIQFIFEYIHLEDENKLDQYVDIIIDCFKTLYLSKFVFKKEKSFFLFEIGYFYDKYFDLESAKKYYLLSADLKNSDALNNLGLIFQTQNEKNSNEANDIPRSIYYFELSAQMNNSFAYLNLAYLYYSKNQYIKQDFQKAKEYFEKSAKLNNSFALFNLGNMYNYGEGVEQDYEKARKYYELSANLNNSHAYNNLGYLYYYGKGVNKDILMAKKCFEMSAKLNNSHGFFFLGDLLSTGDGFDIDIYESIKWLTKCSEIYYEKEIVQNSIKRYDSILIKYNRYCGRSKNDLGLIYLIFLQNVEIAEHYLRNAASDAYPFAQNNYGLLCQFFLKQIDKAEEYYKRSIKENFPLAYFNCGYLEEMNQKKENSIEYYKKASKYEYTALERYQYQHFDKRLDISKTFIICFANLKIFEYYFTKMNYEEAKYYFVKSFSKLILKPSYQFNFELNQKENKKMFSYLRNFILFFPLFNFEHQQIEKFYTESNINMELKSNLENKSVKIIKIDEKINDELIKNHSRKERAINMKIIFTNFEKLYDFIIANEEFQAFFIEEIREIINIMHKIIYEPPYRILFGRINIEKKKKERKIFQKSIDKSFYDGFNG